MQVLMSANNAAEFVIGEIGSGVWFIVASGLSLTFIAYALNKTFLQLDRPRSVISAALAFAIFCAGSAIRGFMTWMQYYYERLDYDVTQWLTLWPWLALSIALKIFGACWAIYIVSPWSWRRASIMLYLLVAVAVPATLYLIS